MTMTKVAGHVVCALVIGFPTNLKANEDQIRVRLDQAKADYQADVKKFHEAVAGHLDKREEAARRDGDKKLVDQIKADRQAWEEAGDLPKSTPRAVTKQLADARSKLDTAFSAAVKDYTRAKDDARAVDIEKEWEEFKKGGPWEEFQKGGPPVVGWKVHFPVGTYSCTYADGVTTTTELKSDRTFFRAQPGGKGQSSGKIEYRDGQLILRGELTETWSIENGKILIRHWYPASAYPKGQWATIGQTILPKK
jgi:hypothetical protein